MGLLPPSCAGPRRGCPSMLERHHHSTNIQLSAMTFIPKSFNWTIQSTLVPLSFTPKRANYSASWLLEEENPFWIHRPTTTWSFSVVEFETSFLTWKIRVSNFLVSKARFVFWLPFIFWNWTASSREIESRKIFPLVCCVAFGVGSPDWSVNNTECFHVESTLQMRPELILQQWANFFLNWLNELIFFSN